MTGSDLDTELRRRAEDAAARILRDAQTEADRLVAEAKRASEERRAVAMHDRESEYRAEARIAIAAERHEAMRTVLEARTRAVERVLREVRSILPEAAETESYVSTLPEQIGEALEYVDGDRAVVRCSPGLVAALKEGVRDRPGVQVEPASDLGTGFVLTGGNGTVLVDGRLETRVDRLAPTLGIEIHARLREHEQ